MKIGLSLASSQDIEIAKSVKLTLLLVIEKKNVLLVFRAISEGLNGVVPFTVIG